MWVGHTCRPRSDTAFALTCWPIGVWAYRQGAGAGLLSLAAAGRGLLSVGPVAQWRLQCLRLLLMQKQVTVIAQSEVTPSGVQSC